MTSFAMSSMDRRANVGSTLLKFVTDTGVFVMIFPLRHNSLLNGTSLFVSWFIGAFLIRHGTRRALRYGVRHG
jgi:hypothetical protein